MTKRTIWLVILLFITNICSFSANKLDWSDTKYKDIDEWIKFGKKHLRRTYRNGGVGPYAFDCSGFTMYMYKELGYALPHSSSAQSDHGEKIKVTHVQPGDLVFYAGSKGSKIGHVGIVIEVSNDDFSFIHASLKQGICIDKSTHPYYKSRYKTARRIYDMTADNSKRRHNKENETEVEPTPLPQEEELELPGQTTDIDTPTNDKSVDNNNSVDNNKHTIHKKKKESRRERRKREKAEKQRLEKQRIEKEKAEKQRLEREKTEKKKQNNARQNTKKEVEKESQKVSPKNEEQPVVTKKTHVVEKGETMYRISKMAGLTVEELKELNGLTSNDLKIGQVLIIEK